MDTSNSAASDMQHRTGSVSIMPSNSAAWHIDREAGARHFTLYALVNGFSVDDWHAARPHVRYMAPRYAAAPPEAPRTATSYVQALRPASEPWGRR